VEIPYFLLASVPADARCTSASSRNGKLCAFVERHSLLAQIPGLALIVTTRNANARVYACLRVTIAVIVRDIDITVAFMHDL